MECTGNTLSPDTDVLSMALYRINNDNILAFVNLRKHECFTSESFILCEIDATDSRKSKLKALVLDLNETEKRSYGCNMSTIASGGRQKFVSLNVTVEKSSKCSVYLPFLVIFVPS